MILDFIHLVQSNCTFLWAGMWVQIAFLHNFFKVTDILLPDQFSNLNKTTLKEWFVKDFFLSNKLIYLKYIGRIPDSRIKRSSCNSCWIKNDKEIKCCNPPQICLTLNLATNHLIFLLSSSPSYIVMLLITIAAAREIQGIFLFEIRHGTPFLDLLQFRLKKILNGNQLLQINYLSQTKL